MAAPKKGFFPEKILSCCLRIRKRIQKILSKRALGRRGPGAQEFNQKLEAIKERESTLEAKKVIALKIVAMGVSCFTLENHDDIAEIYFS